MNHRYTIHAGDCLESLKQMPANSIDAIVTDPPYGLSFMGKRWDYDVPSEAIWRECLRVLKPGGHLLAFAGTRTQHRMAVRIEDAGFEIRDMIAWVYGSGFPKSFDVAQGLQKKAEFGSLRRPEVERGVRRVDRASAGGAVRKGADVGADEEAKGKLELTDPDALRWQGWGTALKPALEPITVARKPLVGTVAANVLQHGVGALNIDGCRVGTEVVKSHHTAMLAHGGQNARPWHEGHESTTHENTGRWPANLIHDGSEEVLAGFPETKSGGYPPEGGQRSQVSTYGKPTARGEQKFTGSEGSAARFFYCAKASKRDRDEGLDGFAEQRMKALEGGKIASAKTPDAMGGERTGRNTHPTVKPTDLMRYLVRLVTPLGGVVLDPFMGSGSTGKACMLEGMVFVGCELSPEYVQIARARIEAALPTSIDPEGGGTVRDSQLDLFSA